jgi:hypothetical protein
MYHRLRGPSRKGIFGVLLFHALLFFFAFPACFFIESVFLESTFTPVQWRYPRNFTVYDAVMYNGESHLLYLRLRLLDPYIDWFVIGYSCWTFQGYPNQNLTFAPLESEIARYSQKLRIFVKCPPAPDDVVHSWDREARMREFIRDSVSSLNPEPTDLILNCDADEIPTRSGLEWIYRRPPTDFYKFRGHYFMYTFRWWMPDAPWIKASVIRWEAVTSLQNLRKQGRHRTPVFALVHCTYCFPDLETVKRKLESFCHHEYAQEPFVNPNYILAAVKCGKGLIPAHANAIAPYPGDIDELMPFRHPELEFLREQVGFREIEGTSKEQIEHFLRYINCTKPEAFEWR